MESQSALVACGVVSLKLCDNGVLKDFAQVMSLIGSKYHNLEASRVLVGKTAVRDNMVKLEWTVCMPTLGRVDTSGGTRFLYFD